MAIKSVGSLSMTEINSEFSYGNNLGAYDRKRWYKFDGTTGSFLSPIRFSDFYGKQKAATYAYIDVKTSTDITVSRSQNIAVLIIGGGGAGGATSTNYPLEGGGGGGGGGFYYLDFAVLSADVGATLRCTIGAGASFNTAGGDTTVSHINTSGVTTWSYTAKGGGRGTSWGLGNVYRGTITNYNSASTLTGASGGGGCPYYGQTNYGTALALSPLQGNNGGRGTENQTGGGGGGARQDSYGVGQSGGGIRNGEGGGIMPQASGGGRGGYGKSFSQYGFSTGAYDFCAGGGSSGGASGGQWRTYAMGGTNIFGDIFGASYVGTAPGDTYLWPSGFAVGGRDGLINGGGGGGGSWALGQNSGNGGSGRVVIWYNP